jgi:quinol-cytochrome oxidoreductase complex cytochrome b subunit
MFDMHVVVLPLSVLLLVGIHMALLQVHSTNAPVGVQQNGMNVTAAGIGALSLGVIALYKYTTKSFDFTSPWFIIPITILPVVAGFFLNQVLLGSGKTSDGKRRGIPFYWNFAMRDYVGWLIGLAVLVAIAVYAPWHVDGDVGMPIDLSKPLVTPIGIHPEWYYMFAFELLRLIPGEIAMILIGVGGAVWFIIPFVDRDSQHERKSPRYTLIGVVLIVGFLGLTWLAYQAVDDEVHQAQINEHVK